MVALWYEPWWYDAWIRPMLFEVENEMSGMIVWDEHDRAWKIGIQWESASDEIQERMGIQKIRGLAFHTHPHFVYLSQHTTRGDPSLPDILVYMRHLYQYDHHTHLVFAKEGMYHISCNPTRSSHHRSSPHYLSPTILETIRLHVEKYPHWDKERQCDSLFATIRCHRLTSWIRQYIPGIRIRFYDYHHRVRLWAY